MNTQNSKIAALTLPEARKMLEEKHLLCGSCACLQGACDLKKISGLDSAMVTCRLFEHLGDILAVREQCEDFKPITAH